MANKWKLKCLVCDKEESFSDSKDVTYAHWKVIGWNIGTGEPKVTCNLCDYKVQNTEKKHKLDFF